MHSLWNPAEAAQCKTDLDLRVYTSRLLGQNKSLVLHGGGNTSVKGTLTNVFGEAEDILFVKGSGWDLETIAPAGFTPVRMAHLLKLAQLPALSDMQMVKEFKTATVDAAAPAPSVEAILHASLPFKFVDHTHADAVVALCNNPQGEARVREVYGDRLLLIPYIMPGFELAQACARAYARDATTRTGVMILMSHGIFTWGTSAQASYEMMIEMVTLAEQHITKHAVRKPRLPVSPPQPFGHVQQAELRHAISQTAGVPMLLQRHASASAFVARQDLPALSQQGPATPDHVIRTKRIPMLGSAPADIARYASDYRRAFTAYNAARPHDLPSAPHTALSMIDSAPRVLLLPMQGIMLTAGRTFKDCAIAGEIYEHTIGIIEDADALGGWVALPESRLFQMEYWDLEQAKLKLGAKPAVFSGEIALVTGAASGIGRACAESLLARGAAVIGLDLAAGTIKHAQYLHLTSNIADPAAVTEAIAQSVERFGGLDMLVINAGIFPKSERVADLTLAQWQKTLDINLTANITLLREAHPLLKLAPKGGRVVVIGSKNVPAPGPGAAAYSASKAALTQLARVTALEWGADNIRINLLHPNMVFDTALWTDELLAARAANYKMTVQEYKTNNVLRAEVCSRDVAELAAEMCGPLFAKTTGAQVPVDGGNERVI